MRTTAVHSLFKKEIAELQKVRPRHSPLLRAQPRLTPAAHSLAPCTQPARGTAPGSGLCTPARRLHHCTARQPPSSAARAWRSVACTAAGTRTGPLQSCTCPRTFRGAQIGAPARFARALATGRPAAPAGRRQVRPRQHLAGAACLCFLNYKALLPLSFCFHSETLVAWLQLAQGNCLDFLNFRAHVQT